MLKNLVNNQSGTTIVELLISVAVLGAVLVGGYSIATRSLNGVQVAKERTEALRLAEGQIEQIRGRVVKARSISDPSISDLVGRVDPFCVAVDSSVAPSSDPECSFGPDHRYRVEVVSSDSPVSIHGNKTAVIFDVIVGWPRSGGGPDESLTLAYRAILDGEVAP